MGIKGLYKTLNNISSTLDDSQKFIYDELTKKDINTQIRSVAALQHHPVKILLNDVDILYFDFKSIIHNVMDKYTGIINDYVYYLVFESPAQVQIYFDQNKLKHDQILIKYTKIDGDNINIAETIKTIKTLRNVETQEIFMIEKIIEETKLIIDLFNKDKLSEINIFYEGIPNISKMKEQCLRSVKMIIDDIINKELNDKLIKPENKDINELYNDTMFKMILPFDLGSQWLINLLVRLKTISDKIVNISDMTKKGEAEHKILEHIKRRQVELTGKKLMFYSPDGDVIILTTYLQNIGINCNLLKSGYKPNRTINYMYKYSFVDTQKLINYILLNTKNHTNSTKSNNYIIMDILFIFNMFGDDFIPCIDSITIDHFIRKKIDGGFKYYKYYDNLNMIFFKYIGLGDKYILNYDSGKYTINATTFKDYLKLLTVDPTELSRFESNQMKPRFNDDVSPSEIIFELDQEINWGDRINLLDYNNISKNPIDLIQGAGKYLKQKDRLNIIFIKKLYDLGYILNLDSDLNYNTMYFEVIPEYKINTTDQSGRSISITKCLEKCYKLTESSNKGTKYVLSTRFRDASQSEKRIEKYLQGIQYVLDLYFNGGVGNNYWYYDDNYAPTLTSIVKYLDTKRPEDINTIFCNYITHEDIEYFTIEEYISYKASVIDNYIKRNLSNINYQNIKKIYNTKSCLNSSYLNKCHNEIIMGKPIDYLKNYRAMLPMVLTPPVSDASAVSVQEPSAAPTVSVQESSAASIVSVQESPMPSPAPTVSVQESPIPSTTSIVSFKCNYCESVEHNFISEPKYFIYKINKDIYTQQISLKSQVKNLSKGDKEFTINNDTKKSNISALLKFLKEKTIMREPMSGLGDIEIITCPIFKDELKQSDKNNWQLKYLKYKQKYLVLKAGIL